jgi:quinoprotein glucose dehydrogenase
LGLEKKIQPINIKNMITPFTKRLGLGALVCVGILSCIQKTKQSPALLVSEIQQGLAERVKEIRTKTPIKIADGLEITLWATDSLAPDPIAMSIDDAGAVYLTRTNRQKHSEFDIRGHQNWMTASISLQSVEERRKFLKETFAPEKSEENAWLEDLNGDGSHDWKDLAVEEEEVWKIEDTNKDGIADVSKRVFKGFNEEITDVAGALLVREKDAFIGVGPDMWRLTDTNKDGIWDKKKSISHGYAVHIGFGGHGMSGAIEGPDGRIYWGIGDIGANLVDQTGKKHEYPNEGVIVRSNPDGSNFEVFASGLRNTHEFVFDAYGNIISSDNDGDHPGESERLVHIVEGSDAGWRANWQYGKYTDPKNNKYKVWMDEKLFKPRWEGQAAYIIPPIMNYHNGPTGMQFNPGTALGKDWLNKFFLVEFVGNPSKSHIWSFGLKPKGASFDLDGETDVVSGILPTGIKFGPDGALYAADWINGWDTKNYGRVWKIDVSADKNDLEAERVETQRLMQMKYPLLTEKMLEELLANADMRIRQKAQFELVDRGVKGFDIFKSVAQNSNNQFARIHAMWGMAQLARENNALGGVFTTFLKDKDAEIIAQAAKLIGDVKYQAAAADLVPLLTNSNDRVKFFAAEALGRLKYTAATADIIKMLETNNDQDVYLRHAGVLALSRFGADEAAINLKNSPSIALRTAAVLVLRRTKNPAIAQFLNDSDEYIATEAARGINDDTSIPEALPALANMLKQEKFKSEPLVRRAINAALRVGTNETMQMLVKYAQNNNISDDMRAEAIATLATWSEPSVLDRVDGRFRGAVSRDPQVVKGAVMTSIPEFLKEKNGATLIAVSGLLNNLQISDFNEDLVKIFRTSADEKVRIATLEALANLNYPKIADIVKEGMQDVKGDVRTAAIGSLNRLDLDENGLEEVVKPIFAKGSIREKQRLINILSALPIQKTEKVLSSIIDMSNAGKLDKEVLLDLSETINNSKSETLINKFKENQKSGDWKEEFSAALFGGNAWEGRKIFNTNSTAQCVRCHAIGPGTGGNVGPSLQHIGGSLDRESLLEALVNPSGRIAPGFGQVSITLKDGQEIYGTLAGETNEEIIITTSDAEPTKIQKTRIAKRDNMPSSMPPMGSLLSKREIRDVVEFLSSLK